MQISTSKHRIFFFITSADIFAQCIYRTSNTQNPGLRGVDLEPHPNRGSDKIDMLKQGRNTQKNAICTVQPGFTYRFQYLER